MVQLAVAELFFGCDVARSRNHLNVLDFPRCIAAAVLALPLRGIPVEQHNCVGWRSAVSFASFAF